jgi:hypothetical protein
MSGMIELKESQPASPEPTADKPPKKEKMSRPQNRPGRRIECEPHPAQSYRLATNTR